MTKLFEKLLQPQVAGIQTYVPGKPISELQREYNLSRVSKLASNENPLGASPKVLQAIRDQLVDIGRYPDGSAYYLTHEMAKFLNRAPEEVAFGNGSNEMLELVARLFAGPGDEIVYSQYAFAIYAISAQIVGATGVEVPAKGWGHDLPAMLKAITPKTKIVYLANPNNPTGTMFSKDEWEAFISKVPSDVIVVLDEAYFEYVNDSAYANGLDYIDDYPNLLVSRTFSKAYGLASLRLGYLVGNKELIGYINKLRAPFNVNHYAQVAAVAAIKDQSFVKKTVDFNLSGMAQFLAVFDKLNINYIPSHGNFVCASFGKKTSEVNQELLKKGVITRPLAGYAMPEYLRISIGSSNENQHFISVITSLMK
ncbi:histidinol-phosphate transaminase [Hydrogenovibrio sp. JE_KL2]|uniref:histidinol-phosphate transaminase n=1 Tax=Hydrogenovibrio sp. JE_KL2 TaxID=2651188 RepID=UPI00128D8EDA|nr:histidinol-phosphate transaminase [Hydrogenovibrio sp. JE_KL2]MPQ75989.1 histidinol-phosphate transaminase [Hydrogenovibrio sp. JE_KL2]